MSILEKVKTKAKEFIQEGDARYVTVAIPKAKAEKFFNADQAYKLAKVDREKTKKEIDLFLTDKNADKGFSAYVTFTYIQPKDKDNFDLEKFKADNPKLYANYVTVEKPVPYYKPSIQK